MGGSGGMMTSLVNSTNVGGGGGGSSFVSNNAALVGLAGAGLSTDEQSAIVSATNPRTKNSDGTQGGYVKIDLLNKDTDDSKVQWIKSDLKLDATISKYFTVATKSTENATVALNGNEVSISNLLLSTKGSAKVELTLTPITGFAGGNDVNLFASDNEFKITAPTGQNAPSALNLGDTHSYVNIPIDGYSIKVNSPATFDSGATIEIDPENLIDSSTVRTIASPKSDFVTEAAYTVNNATPATITAKGTYNYSFTVTPKTETPTKATVGTIAVTQTYSASAIVSQKSSMYLNGIGYEAEENLTYDDATKLYTYSITATSNEITAPEQLAKDSDLYTGKSFTNTSAAETFTAPKDGYYLIQAWGGNGGTGGYTHYDDNGGLAGNMNREGGKGGTGGYIYTVVYLTQDEQIQVAVGANGTKGTDVDKKSANYFAIQGTGGTAGSASYIQRMLKYYFVLVVAVAAAVPLMQKSC